MKLSLSELLRDKFVRGTFFLTTANFGGAFLNYLVHPILARHLSIPAYGDFQALLSFIMIISVLGAVLSTVLTKEMSVMAVDGLGEVNALRRRAIRKFSILGLALFLIIVIFIRPLNDLFHISENAILIIASVNFLYSFPLSVNRAVLSAKQDFFSLALNIFLDPFSRLLFTVLFIIVWPFGLTGAAWAIALNGLVSWFYSFYQVKKLGLPPTSCSYHPSLRRLWRFSLLVFWSMALSQFFYNFDMLFVKSSFGPEDAGLYGALLSVGRIIYFVGAAVPLVMFPVIANLKKNDVHRCYTILGKSLLLMAVLVLPVYAVMCFWPEVMVRIIVGVKYLPLAPYLPGFGLVMLALCVVSVLSSYFLAQARRRSLVIMSGAVILEIVLLSLFHGSMGQVVASLGVSFAAAAAGLLCLVFYEYRRDKRLLRG